MGRKSPNWDSTGLKRGPWTPEEDQKLLAYVQHHGHGSWRSLPQKAGLQRCGKSCRLRWTNYLRPDIKRGKFTLQEDQTIIQLHALLGNRWSSIAAHLPKRTDNEIKNYWNTHLKKRLAKMGVDPVTHKLQKAILGSAIAGTTTIDPKNLSNLSHVAQWETARLQAEARLVRESKSRGGHHQNDHIHQLDNSDHQLLHTDQFDTKFSRTASRPRCLDILRACQTLVLPNLIKNGDENEYDPGYGLLSFDNGGSYSSKNINTPTVSTTMGFEGQYCDDHEQSDLFEVLNNQGTTGYEAGDNNNNGWIREVSNSYGNNAIGFCGSDRGDHDDHEVNKKYWDEVLKFLSF
ncbi:hypothetical protein FNV43_RR20391 [Rhamnella rubrinervis]|uniref:Uncharacterized protein n=1 Tax=Rhamnella rubrinervis TaxID=2594499 RepID=A0A8K0GX02_9ROSA|nr:hypothetical protein FNV43_RR20391 [Rhamnella rubrinervis]